MSSLVGIGLQALNVSQRALELTGQNIANVNTPGYSRQQLVLSSRPAPELGVEIISASRVTDGFATSQFWRDTSTFEGAERFEYYINQLDDLLASSETSVTASMDQYFAALQTIANDPASVPNRELFLAQADALARRFNDMNSLMNGLNSEINARINSETANANQMLGQIAKLNENISVSASRGDEAAELRDQRDELILKLSETFNLSARPNGDGSNIDLFVGNGVPLVIGSNASALTTRPGSLDPDRVEMVVTIGTRSIDVSGDLAGGSIGGMLRFRQEVLDPAQNELGRLAIVFADTMNTQHQSGMDMDGNLGGLLFNDLTAKATIRASRDNETVLQSSSSLAITDAAQLTASEYSINFGSADSFTVTRESDGKRFTLANFTNVATRTPPDNVFSDQPMTYEADFTNGTLKLNIDGVTVDLHAKTTFFAGDEFLLQPVNHGAETIALEVNNGRRLAFASAIRAEPAADNQGDVVVQSLSVTDPDQLIASPVPGQLGLPFELVFDNAGGYNLFNMADPGNPERVGSGTYTSGDPIQLNGFSVVLRQRPVAGDRVAFELNTDGLSDNRNAIALSDLQQTATIDQASYQDIYGGLIESVGSRASVAQINTSASESVLNNSRAVRDGISGVNLDEEAANIVRFQQTYQAAAQLIAASRTLFDTLLNVSGG